MHARALAVSLRAQRGAQLDTGAPHDSTRRILARQAARHAEHTKYRATLTVLRPPAELD